jgi:Ca-activated chloride channel family protein
MSLLRAFTLFLATILLLSGMARADGLIIIHTPDVPTPPGHIRFAPLEVVFHRVDVQINSGGIATTTVDQEFYNPNNMRLEGDYMFPLPPGAIIDRFEMDVNGQMMTAELLPADKARQIYEDIVRRSLDPALLEYSGRDAFRVRIFPIEPQSRKRVKLKYTQVVKSDSGLHEYVYPLNTEKFSARPIEQVSIRVSVESDSPIKSIYSPSHEIDVTRKSERSAVVGFEVKNARPDTDFKLVYSNEKSPVAINLLTYRNSPDDGYFLLIASPGIDVRRDQVQPRDICFVLDTSGSMAGPKLEQAKRALRFCLYNLNPEDRFAVVRFSTEADLITRDLEQATRDNIERVAKLVDDFKPRGGTAIADALAMARKMARSHSDRPYTIVFLTDGQPTIGERDEEKLVRDHTQDNSGLRIFSFGIGTDVNTHLLDRIAMGTRAISHYVLPEEDIEVKVSNFFSKVQSPVLTDVNVRVTGASSDVRISQVYPNQLPDLFKGDTMLIFGRYSGDGDATIELSGTLHGKTVTFSEPVSFASHDPHRAYIPRLWAIRRVGFLLDEIRLRGETPELRDEVVQLAREHGIVTPYTAYLILEDEVRRNVPVALRSMRELEGDRVLAIRARDAYESNRADSPHSAKAGPEGVTHAQAMQTMKDAGAIDQTRQIGNLQKEQAQTGVQGYRVALDYSQQNRVIRGRSFYQNGVTWTDSTAQKRQDLRQVNLKFNSEGYFQLLKAHPESAEYLALGTDIDVVIGEVLYVIRS